MDLELPYKKWLITPDGVSRCRLVLQTQRFLLEMDVEARGVTLRAPCRRTRTKLENPLNRSARTLTCVRMLEESGFAPQVYSNTACHRTGAAPNICIMRAGRAERAPSACGPAELAVERAS